MHPRSILAAVVPALLVGAARLSGQLPGVVINEIHYDEDDPTVHSEFIELHNPAGADPVDLSGWYFSDGVPLVFPAGTTLAGGGYLIVCEDPATIQAKWGVSGANVLSWNQGVVPPVFGRLNNSGGTITLRSATGTKIDEVDYASGFPWPTVGDPPNFSIELINPTLDNSLGGSWRRSDGGNDVSPARNFISLGSAGWHYRKALSEPSTPSTAWRTPEFVEDDTWLTSANGAPFGYPASGSVDTALTDMRMTATVPGYTGIYLRHTFEMTEPAPGPLKLRVFNDDGFVAWLNGQEIARFGPLASTEVEFSAVAGRLHAGTSADVITLPTPNALLNIGTPAQPAKNVLCIHALNTAINDTDFLINAELRFDGNTPAGKPTAAAVNSVFAANAAPAIRQVDHTTVGADPPPEWARSNLDVRITAKITDPEGVASASLAYQIVHPGDYITIDDARYEAPSSWTALPMHDDGLNGDAVAADAVFSALIPASVQGHRRLIRYRLRATDGLGAVARAPYADDPQPNFAYFVYDGIPPWTGKAKPALPEVTYPSSLLSTLPAYHLVTTVAEHSNAMVVPITRADGTTQSPPPNSQYSHSLYNWKGALCYDGHVYDHIRFRARGGVWRFAMGKNMWKFDFNKGHDFQGRDHYGRKLDQKWKKVNFSACIQQGDYNHRGEQGLFESAGFRLFQLSGMPGEHTQFLHFRIIERPNETNSTNPTPSQFDDDFQGLYLAIEQQDGQFLDEHGLPDGNLYKMESGTGELNNQGPTQPKNKSDLNAFIAYGTTETWWRTNCDLTNYYNYRAIVDCIHQYDIAFGKNYFYYHNPVTNKWTVLPWDLDLIWSDNMYPGNTGVQGLDGQPSEPFFSRVFGSSQSGNGPIPVLRLELRNRMREVLDLLFTREQTGMLIDEMASFIYQPGQPSFVDADRAMWDHNPILVSSSVNSSKAGHGRFYQVALDDPATPESERQTFAGMMVKMKNYIASRRTVITNQLLTTADEALVPATPTVTRTGSGAIPTNALTFTTSDFVGKNGATFAALKWRIAEITDPAAPEYLPFNHAERRLYEAEATWESPELPTFSPAITIPASGARPGSTCRVRVKHKDSTGRWSHWSEPVQFVAAEPEVSLYLQSLVVSQFMYNPAPPSAQEAAVASDSDAYEWIELMNIGQSPLDLTPVRFTKGIDFDFAASSVATLLPGQRVLIVKNLAAFNARYGGQVAGTPIAGEWQAGDSLSNGGEQVKLSFGAGTAIRDFTYGDSSPWPDGADGTGHGLVLVNPTLLPDHALSENWRLSAQRLGSPGQGDSTTYTQWAATFGGILPADDTDADQFLNGVEYPLGSSPTLRSSVPILSAGVDARSGAHFLTFTFSRRLGADDVLCAPEVSAELTTWDGRSSAIVLDSARPNGDGTATLVYRLQTPAEIQGSSFVRLRITLAP
jgi:CotH kinase protein/Lamin Tail Domain